MSKRKRRRARERRPESPAETDDAVVGVPPGETASSRIPDTSERYKSLHAEFVMRAYMQPGFGKALMRLAWTCFRADAETALKARLEGAEDDSTRRFLDWVIFAMPVAEDGRTYAQLVMNEIGDSLSPAERIEWERFSRPRWSVFETVRSVAGDATYLKDTATGEVLRVAVEVDPADVDQRRTPLEIPSGPSGKPFGSQT